jgi:F-type H+-transporting ATPase subunit gamma
MAQSLKQIKNRIRSIQSTRKVTNALQMISAVKLSRIDKVLLGLRPYYLNLEGMLRDFTCAFPQVRHPYFEERQNKGNILLCVLTSDNGLCGLYNHNVLRSVQGFLDKSAGRKVSLVVVGKKAMSFFKTKGLPVVHAYVGLNGTYDPMVCDEISSILSKLFLSAQADEVYVAYTHFKSAVAQYPVMDKFLNLTRGEADQDEYILEQEAAHLFDTMARRYLIAKMRMIFLESLTSEHAARSIAMKTATDNAKELLDGLVLTRNKIRQANITQDLLEIISSADALKG